MNQSTYSKQNDSTAILPNLEIKYYQKKYRLLCVLSVILTFSLVILVILAILYFFGFLPGFSNNKVNLEVKLQCTTIVGRENERIIEYLGIPYAMAPINEHRFVHAKEIVSMDDCKATYKDKIEKYDATAYKSACLQFDKDEKLIGSEDCLYLNIYVPPKLKAFEKLPVVVIIHGIFFTFGFSNMKGFQITPETVLGTNTVHVSLNYRLGPLNSFVNPQNNQTNHGLSDIFIALTWIHKNIAKFHGDSSNVVLFGSGTGSSLVLALYKSQLTSNLFSKVWLTSPAFIIDSDLSTVLQNQRAVLSSEMKLSNLQKQIKNEILFNKYNWSNIESKFQLFWFNFPNQSASFKLDNIYFLIKDGYFITDNDLLEKLPNHRVIPMIIGNNQNGIDLLPYPNTIKGWNYQYFDRYMNVAIQKYGIIKSMSSIQITEELKSNYLRGSLREINYEKVYTEAITDLRITCPLNLRLKRMLKRSDSYMIYRYIVRDTHQLYDGLQLGHRSELSSYMWDTIVYLSGYKYLEDYGRWGKNEKEMTSLLLNIMKQFAYGDELGIQRSKRGYVYNNLIQRGQIQRDCYLKLDECQFWASIFPDFNHSAWII